MSDNVSIKRNVVANDTKSATTLERITGVEPAYAAWEAAVLPMNYIRTVTCIITGFFSKCNSKTVVSQLPFCLILRTGNLPLFKLTEGGNFVSFQQIGICHFKFPFSIFSLMMRSVISNNFSDPNFVLL